MNGSPVGFWEATPRILAAAVRGAARRAENAHRVAAWQAWTTAALGRVTRMPPLESLTGAGPAKRSKPQSWKQMLASAEAWVAGAKA